VTTSPSGSDEPIDGTAVTEPSKVTEPSTGTVPSTSEPGPGQTADKERSASSFLRELPILILIAFGLAIVLKTFFVQAFYIPSGSMEPTLQPGDRVLVRKVLYEPERGDIVVFSDPQGRPGPDRGLVGGFLHWLSEGLGFARPEHEDFIKRVIGLPGETVELRNGRLYVDGIRIREAYLQPPLDTRDYGPEQVPEGELFVLGDNRLNSNDSRFGLGFVPVDKVIGRAFVIVWPPSRIGWLR
jgi:signal peptidase I